MASIGLDHGYPDPFAWSGGTVAGGTNFAALVLHIISQQISTQVAAVLFGRLQETIGPEVNPSRLHGCEIAELRMLGISTAKARSLRELAWAQVRGALDVEELGDLDDAAVTAALTRIRGIGQWTAEIFLIHQLHRPDVLPAGDLGIRRAVQRLRVGASLPEPAAVGTYGRRWRPYRTYAAALLWCSLSDEAAAGRPGSRPGVEPAATPSSGD